MTQCPEPGNPPHRQSRADARMFEVRRDMQAAFPAPPHLPRTPPGAASDSELQDWGVLMDAVKARLQQLVYPHLDSVAAPIDPAIALWVRDGVLDCVAALGHLQAGVLQTLGQHRQIEPHALDAQAEWLQASDALGSGPADARQALQDRLTSLPNGRYFQDRLAQALDHARPHRRPLALVWLGLDELDAINQVHGPNVGDSLLQIVAARFKRVVRMHDMVGRLGDDAFACLLYGNITPQQLGRLAGKLGDAVAAPVQLGALCLVVRASVGLARYPNDAQSADALLQYARAQSGQATSIPASVEPQAQISAAGAFDLKQSAGVYEGDVLPWRASGWRAAG